MNKDMLAHYMAQQWPAQAQPGPVISQSVNTVTPYQPPPQQQGGGMNPMSIARQFMPEASAGGTGAGGAAQLPGLQASGATTAGIGMGGTGTGAAAGPVIGTPLAAGGGTAGGGAGGALAAAGPWAALAAIIAINEHNAIGTDRRAEGKGEQVLDYATGKVGLMDTEYFGRKLFGQDNFFSNALRKII